MRVLVVEDEAKVASFIARGLGEAGYTVDVAGQGPAALEEATVNDYDLILLDVMLPGIDGWEVLSQYREGGGNSPVMMLTARDAVEDKVRGLDSGADDYLTKPFNLDLVEIVEQIPRSNDPGNHKILGNYGDCATTQTSHL